MLHSVHYIRPTRSDALCPLHTSYMFYMLHYVHYIRHTCSTCCILSTTYVLHVLHAAFCPLHTSYMFYMLHYVHYMYTSYMFYMLHYVHYIRHTCSTIRIMSTKGGGGNGCHLRVVPPGQLLRRTSTPKRFCLLSFIEPGFSIFCDVKFFVFAFRWFRVFH